MRSSADGSGLLSMRRPAFRIAIPMVIAFVGALSLVKMHFIRAIDHDAQLMWNEDEALLFIGEGELGTRETLAQLASEIVYNLFGGTFEPDNARQSLVVIRHTHRGLEKHVLDGVPMNSYTVSDGQIYNIGGDRWSGSRFEKATDEEVNRFYAAMRGYDRFHPNGGWSYLMGVLYRPEPEAHFPMQIGGGLVELIVLRHGEYKSIQLRTADQSIQDIWHLDESRRWVSKEEYDSRFAR
jgi:hypothetical protein